MLSAARRAHARGGVKGPAVGRDAGGVGGALLQSRPDPPADTLTMRRRFDTALMRPPAPSSTADAALLQRLRAWCERGAFARPTLPLVVAGIAPQASLDGAACALDGSHALARLGRWRGLAWRLLVLARDLTPGRQAQPADPWDCGWWREGPSAAAMAFRPRRATLLLVREPAEAELAALLAALHAGSAAYTRPVRVLVVSERPLRGVPRL